MNKLAKSMLGVVATSTILGSVVASASVSAWGDNLEGGRKSYTLAEINSGKLGKNIVLNSISNNGTIGDEKNFVGARLNDGDHGADNVWNGNEIVAENGKEYIVRMYVHNNNPNGEQAVAKDVTTTFSIPGAAGASVEVNGIVTSSNATPSKYWDNVVFKSKDSSAFHLEYVKGSALLENNGIGKNGGVKLSDDIISKGVKIGYTALDGNVPGCYQYANYITVKVKAVYEQSSVDYTFAKQVRLVGEKEWHESVDAKIGDKVEFQLTYKNTSDATQTGVVVRDVLPTNLSYVKGTTKVYNAVYKDGLVYEDTIGTTGVNLGSYTAGSNAIVRFTAEVADTSMNCGANTMTNWAQVFIGDISNKKDDASVSVNKFCTEPKPTPTPTPEPLPETGLAGVAGGALGLGSITTALGYFVRSKKRA